MDFYLGLSLAVVLPSAVALLIWCGMVIQERQPDKPT
jgi:hypothetical protein